MSSSSTSEKDLRSLDEDSGHDSIGDDVYSSPAEDRERIEHLETVVTWIRQEVNNLKQYDRDILEELWKIRAGIQDIHRAHKQSQEAESKYLDDSIPDRSPSPDEISLENVTPQESSLQPKCYVPTKKASPEQSPSPAPSHTPIEATPPPSESLLQPNRCNTLDLVRTAPTHLMMSDEQLLEEFFGSDQVEKLNQFKKSLDDEKTQKEEAEKEYEAMLRRNVGNKLQIPVNPNRKSSRYSCDVVSEMEQLRARLHETAFKELEEFDKKFSPKLLRPGINPASGEASHSRQGSLDSSFPPNPLLNSPQLMAGHRREFSLPVYMEPSTSGSPQSASGNSSPFASRSATQLLKNQASDQVAVSGENNVRSPTPPFQYGHIRQLSASSTSSGSGTFSPPPTSTTAPLASHQLSASASSTTGGGMSHNMPHSGGSGGALNRYQHYNQASKLSTTTSSGSSPTQQATRVPNPNSSHFHSLKLQQSSQQESHHVMRRMASAGGGSGVSQQGGAGPGLVSLGTNLSPPRNTGSGGGSGLVSIGSLTRNSGVRPGSSGHPGSTTNNSSLNRIRNAVPISSQQVLPNPVTNGVPLRRPDSGGTTQPHYSTAVIKKRKSNPSPDRTGRRSSVEDTSTTEIQTESNGHPSRSATTTPDPSGGSDVFLQPGEQKGVSKSAQQQHLMASYERISYSPKVTRKLMMKVTSVGSAAPSSPQNQSSVPQPSLMLMKSDSDLRERNGPSVYNESIEPYMSSDDLKTQMKYYKYTPYTDCNGTNPVTRQENPESTWC